MLGVVDLPESARRTLPSLFINSRIFLGDREGPKPAVRNIKGQLDWSKYRYPNLDNRTSNLSTWEEGEASDHKLSLQGGTRKTCRPWEIRRRGYILELVIASINQSVSELEDFFI